MSYTELVEKIKQLPGEKQREVFDFVDYLTLRFTHSTPAIDTWNEQEFAELSMQQALRGMDDDPIVYSDADLKEHWQ
ncbi:MAG: DUF2281 domain-containing protein [Chromatiaceae bacterium]|nr:DUF2281 domain-containing protein [Chromatiaceae bacterium]